MAVSEFLRDVIAELKAAGAVKARVEFEGSSLRALDVEFAPAPAAAGFTDAAGKPVDLDAGAGPLTKDPDDDLPVPVLEASDAALEQANFKRKPNGKAA